MLLARRPFRMAAVIVLVVATPVRTSRRDNKGHFLISMARLVACKTHMRN